MLRNALNDLSFSLTTREFLLFFGGRGVGKLVLISNGKNSLILVSVLILLTVNNKSLSVSAQTHALTHMDCNSVEGRRIEGWG